jgi:hypothetical protein
MAYSASLGHLLNASMLTIEVHPKRLCTLFAGHFNLSLLVETVQGLSLYRAYGMNNTKQRARLEPCRCAKQISYSCEIRHKLSKYKSNQERIEHVSFVHFSVELQSHIIYI